MCAKIKFNKKRANDNICQTSQERWKLLIVDDEPEVHNITKIVLSKFSFNNKGLEFLSAYNSHEAINLLQNHSDISVILLDVVMDSDDAGLKIAKMIRQDLKNYNIRIILRTGQPGVAPPKEVILNYDINDYKEKTELTADKLFITVVSALRSYQQLKIIEKNEELLLKQSKFAAMGEIMDAVAHQWKQPLNLIKVILEGLEIKFDIGLEVSKEDIKEAVKETNKQINHLIQTVDDFRAMLKQKVSKKNVGLKSIIDETLEILHDNLMKYNIKFRFVGEEDIKVDVVPTEFKHILINIVNNAKDEFERRKIKDRMIIFEWEEEKDYINFKIIDNAGGIPQDIIDKIFEMNFTTKEEGKGSGMGLYMTELFCEKMDIKIKALNVDNGACFNLLIPKKENESK